VNLRAIEPINVDGMDPGAPEPTWFVVRASPGQDAAVAADLDAKGFTVYAPKFRREYQHRRSKKWIIRTFPLMVGYLFVQGSPDWASLLHLKGVTSILRNRDNGEDGKPILVKDQMIRAIMAAEQAGEFDILKVHGHVVKIGQLVKVAEGPLAGLAAPVHAVNNARHVKVLLNILGREVETTVPVENLLQTQ
jgi:transcription antitermination factor NusG